MELFKAALEVDNVVLGGENVNLLKALPPAVRRVDNDGAFLGGFLVWNSSRVETGASGA